MTLPPLLLNFATRWACLFMVSRQSGHARAFCSQWERLLSAFWTGGWNTWDSHTQRLRRSRRCYNPSFPEDWSRYWCSAVHVACHVRISIEGKRSFCVSQNTGECFRIYATGQSMGGKCVPLRYNYDKPEKPRISRVFGYQARFFILFQPEKSSREVVIS